MKSFFVYILECRDRSFYIGVTSHYIQRVWQHQEGIYPSCYTFRRRSVQLVHLEEFSSILDAIAREKQLKRWSRAKKRAFIMNDEQLLKALSRSASKDDVVRQAHHDVDVDLESSTSHADSMH